MSMVLEKMVSDMETGISIIGQTGLKPNLKSEIKEYIEDSLKHALLKEVQEVVYDAERMFLKNKQDSVKPFYKLLEEVILEISKEAVEEYWYHRGYLG